jgi:ATP-dependent DNA helicase DinG
MRCTSCGFNLRVSDAPKSKQCHACGKPLAFDSDDFLLHQHGAPGREVRTGQVQMGRLVEQVIREHAIAFIEAPVGSGKSDAYGVPSINAASKVSGYSLKNIKDKLPSKLAELKDPKARIVISTAKKNLQHQIAEKDLPFIRKRHGEETIGIALLKGKGNYACRLKAETSLEPHDKAQFKNWLSTSPTEDLSDFPGGKRPPYLFDVTAEDCIGRSCEYAQADEGGVPQCGYWRSRLAAAKASVLVTNHHVVAYDLRYGPGVILGPYTTLILDEAHQAPASFRAAFSSVVGQGATTRMVRQMDAAAVRGGYAESLKGAWKGMFDQLADTDGEIPKDPFGTAGDDAISILSEISVDVSEQATDLGWSSAPGWDIKSVHPDNKDQLLAVMALKKTIERTGQSLNTAKAPSDNTVLYVTTSDKGHKKLTMAPISVGKLVGRKLQMIPSVVITSATMAIGGRFDDAKYQLGLNWDKYQDEEGVETPAKKIHELVLGTPFNYDKQALLYTPTHIPVPVGQTAPGRLPYITAVTNECIRLVEASNGNAFILFTSKQDLLDVHEGMLSSGMPMPLIVQEDDAAATFRAYMATSNSVLLGVKSFWEGVDVQGQKLQLVIITKLPFPALTDPVLQARSRQLIKEQVAQGVSPITAKGAVFNKLQIPHMLTELRQGAGRLIRATTDKGVLAILDCRMFTGNSKDLPLPGQKAYRGYGKLTADATGFNNRVTDFDVVERVFENWNR